MSYNRAATRMSSICFGESLILAATIWLSSATRSDRALRWGLALCKYLDRTYLIMLMKHGLKTAIVNSYDEELMAIAKGERQDLVDLVFGMMDGNDPDPSTLSGTALEHFKTVNVLTGKTVFSESWLEL